MAVKKNDEVKKGLPEWMATYGDMVTLLLCFFVLLFSMSSADVEKFQQVAVSFNNSISVLDSGGGEGINNMIGNGIMQMPDSYSNDAKDEKTRNDQKEQELKEIANDLKTYFAENEYSSDVAVQQEENYVKLTFSNGVLFDSGSAELKPDSKIALDLVATELNKYGNNKVKIEGHTDNIPIHSPLYPDNMYLSAARSIAVLNYFKDVHGIAPVRMSQEGFGEYAPIASNDTPENRAKNRRVEIKIMSSFE